MADLVERIARGIYWAEPAHHIERLTWECAPDVYRIKATKFAQAALQAIEDADMVIVPREPMNTLLMQARKVTPWVHDANVTAMIRAAREGMGDE